MSSIVASNTGKPTSLYGIAAELIHNGFHSGSINDYRSKLTTEATSVIAIKPLAKQFIYPRVESSDPTYDVLEFMLIDAIKIPKSFTFGKKPPVILVPGTGSTGFLTYSGNYIKLLSNVDYADPVWLDIPGFLQDDAQTSAVRQSFRSLHCKLIYSRNMSPMLSTISTQ